MTAKKRRACQRNGWRHGRRASLPGLLAHYGISARHIKEIADVFAKEWPDRSRAELEDTAKREILCRVLLYDVAVRGTRIEVPIVRDGQVVGIDHGANSACAHLIAFRKPDIDRFLARKRKAREDALAAALRERTERMRSFLNRRPPEPPAEPT